MTITNKAAFEKVTKARASLLIKQPFFASLALRMGIDEKKDIETFATNGKMMFYNPDFVMSISIEQVKTEIAHEVMHPALQHLDRVYDRDFTDWNRAGDYPINEMLHKSGFKLDDTYLLEPAFFGMSADEIYNIIHHDKNHPANQKGKTPSHMQQPDPNAPKPDPAQQAKDALDWKIAVVQAAQAAKQVGKLPGALEEFVKTLLPSRVDWKTALRQFVTTAFEDDYSWLHPNRMMLGAHGIVLPGLFTEKTKPLAIFKDISASIGDKIQNAFNAEIEALWHEMRPEKLHSMYIDTRVARYDVFEQGQEIELVNMRGGGTDFAPPFAKLEELGVEPACAIYLTDMEGPFPKLQPPYPVLWVSINEHAPQPPFGEMTVIKVD